MTRPVPFLAQMKYMELAQDDVLREQGTFAVLSYDLITEGAELVRIKHCVHRKQLTRLRSVISSFHF